MDSVFVEGLKLRGIHGVHPRERKSEQEFVVDIRAEMDLSRAASSDGLTDTADYSHFETLARECVERNSFYLIERLAGEIAQVFLESDQRFARVMVTIRKPQALGNGIPGCTIARARV